MDSRFLADRRAAAAAAAVDSPTPPMDSKNRRARMPRLERRNAIKNIEYETWSASDPITGSSPSSAGGSELRIRSLELSPYLSQTSFRVDGVEGGEFERICRNLGLSGPEDFAIPTAAWDARKARSSSDLLPRSRLHQDEVKEEQLEGLDNGRGGSDAGEDRNLATELLARVRVTEEIPAPLTPALKPPPSGGGVKGNRPPVLVPPPSMSLPVLDRDCSTWDLVKSFAPDEDPTVLSRVPEEEDEPEEEMVDDEDEDEENDGRLIRMGETSVMAVSCSFSTSIDDDASSTTMEPTFLISPQGKFRRTIRLWERGNLLGSGSFGTVYEGISDDGFFFAVKEVSLLDQGSKAQQCINQLEQEIALLSQFEHENIVQYLGTDKEETKLYIFLELITQGSLASLYQKYHLRDSQVSSYTRQILSGLKYLHDRNVMHRDIKCANILVDASGSVKLADFGLAKETSKLNVLKSCQGSAYWMAPEELSKSYAEQVVNPRKTYGLAADIWSLGCSVLELSTGQLPYSNLEWTQALFKIGRGEPPIIPDSLSLDARDFVQQCLRVEPDDRPSAAELLSHPFVKRQLPVPGSVSPTVNR